MGCAIAEACTRSFFFVYRALTIPFSPDLDFPVSIFPFGKPLYIQAINPFPFSFLFFIPCSAFLSSSSFFFSTFFFSITLFNLFLLLIHPQLLFSRKKREKNSKERRRKKIVNRMSKYTQRH